MAVPAQIVKKEFSGTVWTEVEPQLEIGDLHLHFAPICPAQTPAVRPDILGSTTESQTLHPSPDLASVEKTRTALLQLDDDPTDNSAMTTLCEENREAIEAEMNRHLRSFSESALLERIIGGLISHARFFCAEIDDPKAWVARCANLEARRVALELGNKIRIPLSAHKS